MNFHQFKIPTKQKEPGSSDSFCFVAEPGIEPESKVSETFRSIH